MGFLKRTIDALKKHRLDKKLEAEETKRVAAENATLGVVAPTTESDAIKVAKEQKKKTTSTMRGDKKYHQLTESELSALNLTDTLQVNGVTVMPVVEMTAEGSYKIGEERIAKDSELTVEDIVYMYQSTREKYAFRDIVQTSLTEKYKPMFAKRTADSEKTLYQELEDEQKQIEEARKQAVDEINERRKKELEELEATTGVTREQQTAPFEAARQNEQAIQGFYKQLQDACEFVGATQQDRISMKFLKNNFVNDALDELDVAEGYGEYLEQYSRSVDVPVSVLAIYDLVQQGAIPSIEEISVIQRRIRGEGKKAGQTYTLGSKHVKALYQKRSQIKSPTMRSFFDEMVGFTVDEEKGVIVPLTDNEGKPRNGKFEEYTPAIAVVAEKVQAEVDLSTMIGIAGTIKENGQSQRRVERQVDSEYEAERKKINDSFDAEVSEANAQYNAQAAQKRTEYAELVEQSEYFDVTGLNDLVSQVMTSFEEQYGDKVDSVIDKTHAKDTVRSVELAFGLMQKAVNTSLQTYYSEKYTTLMDSYKLPEGIANLTAEETEELTKDNSRKIVGYQQSRTPFIKKYAKDFATITSYNEQIYVLQDRVVRYELTNPEKANQAKLEIEALRQKSAAVLKSIEAREEVEQARNLLNQVRYNSLENTTDLRDARVKVLERDRQKSLKAADTAESEEEKKNKTNLSKIESDHKKNVSAEEERHRKALDAIEAENKKKIAEENAEYARILKTAEAPFDVQIVEETRRHNSELAKLTSINKAELSQNEIKLQKTTETLEEVIASQEEVIKEEYLKSVFGILSSVNSTFELGGRAKSNSNVKKIIERLTKESKNLTADELRERILEEVETVTRENIPSKDKRNKTLIDQRVADSLEDVTPALDAALATAEKRNESSITHQQLLEKRIELIKQRIKELKQPTVTNTEALEAENAEHDRRLEEIEQARNAEIRRLEQEHDSVLEIIRSETRDSRRLEEERHDSLQEQEQISYDQSLELESERHEYALSDVEASRKLAQQTYDNGVEQADNDLLLAVRHIKSKSLSDGFGLLSAGIERLQTRLQECRALSPDIDVSEIESTIESYKTQQTELAKEAEKYGLTLTPDGTELTDEQYLEKVKAERKAEEEKKLAEEQRLAEEKAAKKAKKPSETVNDDVDGESDEVEVNTTITEQDQQPVELTEQQAMYDYITYNMGLVRNMSASDAAEVIAQEIEVNEDLSSEEKDTLNGIRNTLLNSDETADVSEQIGVAQTICADRVNGAKRQLLQDGVSPNQYAAGMDESLVRNMSDGTTISEEQRTKNAEFHKQDFETFADQEQRRSQAVESGNTEVQQEVEHEQNNETIDQANSEDIIVPAISKVGAAEAIKALDKELGKLRTSILQAELKEKLDAKRTASTQTVDESIQSDAVDEEEQVAVDATTEPKPEQIDLARKGIAGALSDAFGAKLTTEEKREALSEILKNLSEEELSQLDVNGLKFTTNGKIKIGATIKALKSIGVDVNKQLRVVEHQLKQVADGKDAGAESLYERMETVVVNDDEASITPGAETAKPEDKGKKNVATVRNAILAIYGRRLYDRETLESMARELAPQMEEGMTVEDAVKLAKEHEFAAGDVGMINEAVAKRVANVMQQTREAEQENVASEGGQKPTGGMKK